MAVNGEFTTASIIIAVHIARLGLAVIRDRFTVKAAWCCRTSFSGHDQEVAEPFGRVLVHLAHTNAFVACYVRKALVWRAAG